MILDIKITHKDTAMRMMMNIKRILLSILLVDLLLVIYSLSRGMEFLLNSQLAFVASFLVTISSYLSYKKMIEKRLQLGNIDTTDLIDKIEDEFDLYDDEKMDVKELIKQERKKMSIKKGTKNLIDSRGGIFNPIRLLSYLFLFITLIYLIRNNHFEVSAYLLGLGVVPIGTLLGSFTLRYIF